jgi:hypothetical protein
LVFYLFIYLFILHYYQVRENAARALGSFGAVNRVLEKLIDFELNQDENEKGKKKDSWTKQENMLREFEELIISSGQKKTPKPLFNNFMKPFSPSPKFFSRKAIKESSFYNRSSSSKVSTSFSPSIKVPSYIQNQIEPTNLLKVIIVALTNALKDPFWKV